LTRQEHLAKYLVAYRVKHRLTRGLVALTVAAAAGLLLSGCSEIGFPNVHDMPAPRADTPLTPDQVKQATDDLTSERDRLQSNTAAAGPAPAPQNAVLKPPAAPAATQTAGADTKP
jgi:hypothetical protein